MALMCRIFVQPYYCGGILGQSLAFNRRSSDKDYEKAETKEVLNTIVGFKDFFSVLWGHE